MILALQMGNAVAETSFFFKLTLILAVVHEYHVEELCINEIV
jgi:hypothetical protein